MSFHISKMVLNRKSPTDEVWLKKKKKNSSGNPSSILLKISSKISFKLREYTDVFSELKKITTER